MKKLALVSVFALLLGAPNPARAQDLFFGQTCHAADLFNVFVTGCYGFQPKNLNNGADLLEQQSALSFLLGGTPTPHIIIQRDFADGSQLLDFGVTMYGVTVVAFHWGGGNDYTGNSTAFYKFDAGTIGIHSITLAETPQDLTKAISNGAIYVTDTPPVTVTPEPVTILLLGTGLASMGGVGLVRRRKKNGDIENA